MAVRYHVGAEYEIMPFVTAAKALKCLGIYRILDQVIEL